VKRAKGRAKMSFPSDFVEDEPPSIMLDTGMRQALIQNAVDAYLAREQGEPDAKRNPVVD